MRSIRPALASLFSVCLALSARTQQGGLDGAVPEDLGLFRIARLHYTGGGDWYANPSSLPNLQRELERRTGIRCAERELTVTLDDERLFSYPMLYVTGHGDFRLSRGDLDRLRRYLDAGGFLWVDDNYGLDKSFRALAAELYPQSPLTKLPGSHPIYRSWYSLPGLPKIHEHDGEAAQGFGIFHEGRLAVFYTWSSDIGDGLEDAEVHGDSAPVREAALQMAINVCVFEMTQH
jgi:hypothetical protein